MIKIENPLDCLYVGANREYYVSVERFSPTNDYQDFLKYPTVIQVAETANNVVLAKLALKTGLCINQCIDSRNDTHVNNGIIYFVLSEAVYKQGKYVYSFDPEKKSIQRLLGPLNNPNFFQNRVIEFGDGFIQPGFYVLNTFMRTGRALIKIYALPEAKMIKQYPLTEGTGDGWQGSIDEKTNQVIAFDHVLGKRFEFPIPKENLFQLPIPEKI